MKRIYDRIAVFLLAGVLILGVAQIIGANVDQWLSTTFSPADQTGEIVESP